MKEYRSHPDQRCYDCVNVAKGFVQEEDFLMCMFLPKHEDVGLDDWCRQFKKREGPIVLVWNDL